MDGKLGSRVRWMCLVAVVLATGCGADPAPLPTTTTSAATQQTQPPAATSPPTTPTSPSSTTVSSTTVPETIGRDVTPAERLVTINYAACGESEEGSVSGFVYRSGLIATSTYPAMLGSSFTVVGHDGVESAAHIVASYEPAAVALLTVEGFEASPVETAAAYVGSRLVTHASVSGELRHGVEHALPLTIGGLSDVDGGPKDAYQLNVATQSGDTGGGVYNESGKLVGMLFAVSSEGDRAFAIAADEIETVIADLDDNGPVAHTCDPESSRLVPAGDG